MSPGRAPGRSPVAVHRPGRLAGGHRAKAPVQIPPPAYHSVYASQSVHAAESSNITSTQFNLSVAQSVLASEQAAMLFVGPMAVGVGQAVNVAENRSVSFPSGGTYFVNNAAANDSGTGTIASPWKYLQTHIGTPVAGDIVYLRGGASRGAAQEYTESITISDSNGAHSGSAGQPITIRPYANEYIKWTPPAGSVRPFTFTNRSYWTIDGLNADFHLYFDMTGTNNTMSMIDINGSDHITVRYIEAGNGRFDEYIRITNASDNVVEYCLLYLNEKDPYTDASGVWIFAGSDVSLSDDNIVRYNEIYDCHGDCVGIGTAIAGQMGPINRTLVYGNHGYTTPTHAAGCENFLDIKESFDADVYQNTAHGFRECTGSTGGSGGGHGMPIMIHDNAEITAKVHDNTFYDFAGSACGCFSGVDTVEIYRNLMYDLAYDPNLSNPDWETVFYVLGNGVVKIYNNTVIGTHEGDTNSKLVQVHNYPTLTIRNNVFYGTGKVRDHEGSGKVVDHNAWYNYVERWSGTGDVTADPLLMDPGSDDYTLQPGSPCKNAGTLTGLPAGITYNGSAPDLGYYELSE